MEKKLANELIQIKSHNLIYKETIWNDNIKLNNSELELQNDLC